ncbi:fungal-specific transcription factor domain-containing protein [Pyrenochaeta sp. MPI-SDFR-AT-0127]|nr:fungal-specific transcription factor domain-containing protein [Pyrenochaeta sp. MPI-SDFR-AT-0127]
MSSSLLLCLNEPHKARRSPTYSQEKSTKSTMACDRCRLKKIKCDGSQSCKSCVTHGVGCHYSRTTRRYRGSTKDKTRHLQERLGHAERLLRTAGLIDQLSLPSPPATSQIHGDLGAPLQTASIRQDSVDRGGSYGADVLSESPDEDSHTALHESYQDVQSPLATLATVSGRARNCNLLPNQESINGFTNFGSSESNSSTTFVPLSPNTITLSPTRFDTLLSASIQNPPVTASETAPVRSQDRNQQVVAGEPPSRDEHHGPNSYLSICADAGVNWIASRIGASSFDACATSLVSTISQKLKLSGRLSKDRIPEPCKETAWLYMHAYFDESLEATYYTINRSTFEARLEKDFSDQPDEYDPAWYALKNVVFASGCRIATFKTQSWTEAQIQSRGYFENALAVEADLLHGTTGVIAIQALLAMALYAEGAGSAKLEYMLVSCAVRLAHARGLHLRPASSITSLEDLQRRSWIFWTIYCFEKHLTLRAGRPSIIDDDDISCELPTWAPDANPNIVVYFQHTVKQAMICSAIAKSFSTVKARERSLSEKVKLVKYFTTSLRAWYQDIPEAFRPGFPLKPESLPYGIRAEHLIYTYLSYHGSMAAIHSTFGHPWNLNQSLEHQNDIVKAQIASSNEVLADASRNIILITRSISVDAVAPVWLVFYYPLLGMINTFVSILKTPTADSTSKDIGLIDMAAGYFAYVNHSTDSVLSFSFVHHIGQWARQAVSKAQARTIDGQETMCHSVGVGTILSLQDDYASSICHMGGLDIDGMNFGDWPAFLPRLPHVEAWQ